MPDAENRNKFQNLAGDMERHPENYGGESELLREVIVNLNGLEYDDFANEKYDAPKMKMIEHFTALGRDDIVEEIKNGEYDQ